MSVIMHLFKIVNDQVKGKRNSWIWLPVILAKKLVCLEDIVGGKSDIVYASVERLPQIMISTITEEEVAV